MRRVKRFLAVATIAGLSAIGAGAAAALPVDKAPLSTASSETSNLQQVRWHHGYWHGRHWHHRHWRHRYWHHRHWRHHYRHHRYWHHRHWRHRGWRYSARDHCRGASWRAAGACEPPAAAPVVVMGPKSSSFGPAHRVEHLGEKRETFCAARGYPLLTRNRFQLPATAALAKVSADAINSAEFSGRGAERNRALIAKAEILLDRRHFSPGVIDGSNGENFRKALAAFQRSEGLKPTGKLNIGKLGAPQQR